MTQKKQFPRIIHSVLIVIFWILLSFTLGVLAIIYYPEFAAEYSVYFLGLTNSITIGLILVWGFKKSKLKVKDIYKHHNLSWRIMGALVLYGLSFAILFSEVDNLVRYLFPMPDFWLQSLYDFFYNKHVWATIFVVTFVASITEEFFCRGFLLAGFLRNYSTKTSVIISSLLFAVMHVNPWGFISYFLAGLFLALLYVKTKNIFYCIFLHACFNFFGIFAIRILEVDIPGFSTLEGFQPWWFNLTGVTFFAAAVFFSKNILFENKKDKSVQNKTL